jgi:hypothetical protein
VLFDHIEKLLNRLQEWGVLCREQNIDAHLLGSFEDLLRFVKPCIVKEEQHSAPIHNVISLKTLQSGEYEVFKEARIICAFNQLHAYNLLLSHRREQTHCIFWPHLLLDDHLFKNHLLRQSVEAFRRPLSVAGSAEYIYLRGGRNV